MIEIDDSKLGSIGVAKPIELAATRYTQGGREMYHLVVTLAGLTQLVVKRPDPDRPIEGNRKVDGARARKFATYILAKDRWVSPAIIVRVPSGEVGFTAVKSFDDGTSWGVLAVPLHVLSEILLLDGQHRTLGTFYALDEINSRIAKTKDAVAAAKANQDGTAAVHEARLAKELETRERLSREHISVDLAVVTSDTAKQMFADINNNAKGVNPDYTTYLDQANVVNRIALELINEHQLLVDRVELGQESRMSPRNPNLIGAKSVADIVRTVHVGLTGRIGRRIDDEMTRNQAAAANKVKLFLDLLMSSFEDLRAVAEGRLDAIELREKSMLGSMTMLKALAAVYYNLTAVSEDGSVESMSRSDVQSFFQSLQTHMGEAPITRDNEFWMSTGAFLPGSAAPQARAGSFKQLVEALTQRARDAKRLQGAG